MYLKAIEVQGFKSFPDKTVLNFDRGMTAVVGPNGSGKSNISDAVRWVLGEQSTRNLRGAKMEDVIFSGTQTRRPQGFAEVSLKLDNKDKSLNFETETVSVTRRYYRSGESEYLLNGKIVRLRDIHELFMDTGLGRDGYSRVSQGRIEDIVSAKSNERREMFEEAAGISHFRYRRADTLRRLEQSEDNLLRLRDILAVLEGRVEPLRLQSQKAEKFLLFSEEKKSLEIGLWLFNYNRAGEVLREQSNKVTVVEMQCRESAGQIEKIYEKSEEATREGRELTFAIEEIRRGMSDLEEQASSIEAEIAVEKNTVEHNKAAIERLLQDKLSENEIQERLNAKLLETEEIINELNKRIAQKREGLSEASRALEEIRFSGEESSKELNNILVLRNEVFSELSDTRIALSSSGASNAELDERMKAVNSDVDEKEQSLKGLEERIAELQKMAAENSEKSLELKNSVSALEMKINLRSQKEQNLKQGLDTQLLASKQTEGRIHLLEDMEKNMEGYTGSVRAIMKEVKRETLRGIHGPLSQLISVEEAYTCAIETALGAAMQNIVTENENDAKRAMYHLKDNNLGRATFLPLSSIRSNHLEEKGLEKQEGYINIADRLVSCDGKYKAVVASLLGRTVVVEDIDCAIEISKKYTHRFKIVTLDGQVIHSGGSMTGGSSVQNAGFLTRSNEIEKLKKQLETMKAQALESEKAYRAIFEELSQLNALLKGTNAELMLANENAVRLDSLLNLAAGQREDSIKFLSSYKNELNMILEKKSLLEKEMNANNKQSENLNLKLQQLDEKIEELGKGHENLLLKKDELNERSSKVNIEIAEILKEIQASKDISEDLEKRSASHNNRIEMLEMEINGLEQKNNEIYEKISLAEGECGKIRDKLTEKRNLIDEHVKRREIFEKQVNDLRQEERSKTEENSRLAQELARLQERLINLEKEQETIEKQLYDEYNLTRREAERLELVIESVQKASKRLSELKSSIRSLGNVNVSAIEEYKEVSERYDFLKTQLDDTEKSKKELEKLIEELTQKMAQQFSERFKVINEQFKECFYHLFSGGEAELVLEDASNVLECAIEIKAQPPGKNVKSLSLLSGGEKGLCAIAILFAMLKVAPSPFCIFDEIEAALDDVNVVRFAQFVRKMTKDIQFILITHRRGTMEEADCLYGVTMQEEGVSKLLELKTVEMANILGLDTVS